ncbi:hypothetical protein XENORESO_011000 [Xenotaenia resolanae]|uniref:Uncharacterized protein n=1 Tax=Xenotaenia resolanae TaxID=208358 RepID=A0ABV0VW61_9TELE
MRDSGFTPSNSKQIVMDVPSSMETEPGGNRFLSLTTGQKVEMTSVPYPESKCNDPVTETLFCEEKFWSVCVLELCLQARNFRLCVFHIPTFPSVLRKLPRNLMESEVTAGHF